MENASKALIIAGGILIAMLIISIGVYLFNIYQTTSSQYNQNLNMQEIEKFNSNFTKYIGRKDITIYEIVTTNNFAIENGLQVEINNQLIKTATELIKDNKYKKYSVIENRYYV